jgi:hypothetical protein
MNRFWVWAAVAAIGLGTTAAAANAESKLNNRPPQQKRSHVSHSKHAPQAKHAEKRSASPAAAKKVAKSAAKPQAKKAVKSAAKPAVKKADVKHESKPAKGRLAKRHS